MDQYKGKVIIITGASSGIGAATAEAYAKQGAWLSLTGRDEKRLKETAEKCQSHGVAKDNILLTLCDLVEATSYDLIVKNTVEKFGKIDVLVNNAGAGGFYAFEDEPIEYVDYMYKLLLRAPFFLSQKALPYLKQTKGSIINVSSFLSTSVATGETTYCMLKAGLDHLTRVLAIGFVRTLITVHSGMKLEDFETFLKNEEKKSPTGRIVEPSETAAAILFLTSSPAMSITGVNLLQDCASGLTSAWTLPPK